VTTNITLRLEDTLIRRIDKSAERQGLTRTAYILSWLPDTGLEHANRHRNADAQPRLSKAAPTDSPSPRAMREGENFGR
jgi:hypothetical protein